MDLEDLDEVPPPPPPPPSPASPPPLTSAKVPRRSRKPKEEEKDDEDTKRRRDVLAQAIIMETLSGVTVKSVRTMKKKDLDTLYEDYSLQLSKQMAMKVLDRGTSAVVSLLDRYVGLESPEELRSSIVNNVAVRRNVGKYCANVTEQYGDVVEWINLSLDLFKQTRKKVADDSSKELQEVANDGRGEANEGSS